MFLSQFFILGRLNPHFSFLNIFDPIYYSLNQERFKTYTFQSCKIEYTYLNCNRKKRQLKKKIFKKNTQLKENKELYFTVKLNPP